MRIEAFRWTIDLTVVSISSSNDDISLGYSLPTMMDIIDHVGPCCPNDMATHKKYAIAFPSGHKFQSEVEGPNQHIHCGMFGLSILIRMF
jgi:hypothetical protein